MLGFNKQEDPSKGIKQDIRAYKKLGKIKDHDEVEAFFDMIIDVAAKKMLWTFTDKNVENWDDFCKARGEVISYLYPIQQVYGADVMVDHLKAQLDQYRESQVE